MKPTSRCLSGYVQMLGRGRVHCRIASMKSTGAEIELLERAHLLQNVGLVIGDGPLRYCVRSRSD